MQSQQPKNNTAHSTLLKKQQPIQQKISKKGSKSTNPFFNALAQPTLQHNPFYTALQPSDTAKNPFYTALGSTLQMKPDFTSTPINDPLIQKADREGGSSQSGTNEEQVSCPPTEEIDEIEQRYRDMIETARQQEAHVAADNLEHFLAGSGTKRVLSVSWLRGFSDVTSAERRNESRFADSLNDIANSMPSGATRNHHDYWDAQFTGSGELYYASGTSTIRSTGNFQLDKTGDTVTISGTVDHHWFDPYDWHGGLAAWVPGFGSISDEDGLIMQSCRGASPFEMEADWQRSLGGTIEIGYVWNTRNLNWTGP